MKHLPFVDRITIVLALLLAGQFANAAERTAWLIYPGVAESPSIEMLPEQPGTWRLKSRRGQVLAAMTQPALPSGHTVNYGQCKVAGLLRDDVLAFVRHEPGAKWSTNVFKLWIANPATRAFEVAKTEGVSCLNEGYGV